MCAEKNCYMNNFIDRVDHTFESSGKNYSKQEKCDQKFGILQILTSIFNKYLPFGQCINFTVTKSLRHSENTLVCLGWNLKYVETVANFR